MSHVLHHDKLGFYFIVTKYSDIAPPLIIQTVSRTISYSNPLSNFKMSTLRNYILLTFRDTVNGSYYELQLKRTDLTTHKSRTINTYVYGFYVNTVDYAVKATNVDEQLIDRPRSTEIYMGSYVSGTSYPADIIYMLDSGKNKMFAFYKDLSFFVTRDLLPVTPMALVWATPTVVNTPNAGVLCACFYAGESSIFIVDALGSMMTYKIATGELIPIVSIAGFSGVIDCLYN